MKISEIKKRRITEKNEKVQQRKEGVFEKLSGVIVHIIFIVIYLSTMNYEMKQKESFELNKAIENHFIIPQFAAAVGSKIIAPPV
jgi:hypothetical protein